MNNKLPALAFGGRTAQFVQCPYNMGDQLRGLIKGLKAYESMAKPSEFLSQSSLLNINGLKLAATSSTPVQYKTDKTDKTGNAMLLIPFSGEGSATVGQRTINYRVGNVAAFLPGDGAVEGKCSARSLLMANIDTNRLEQTARGMLGVSPDAPSILDLNSPREVNLHFGSVSFDAIFRQYAGIINQFVLMPQTLNKMGLDDGFYSATVMMLQPSLFLGAASLASDIKYEKRLLDKTCQYIQANLTQPITLVMLDQVSSMSRRKLHYAFQDRYSCTPMQWVRLERLALAHSRLAHAQFGTTVTEVALSCGFTKMSTFAYYYHNRFGELPSATLSRAFSI
jgi:AraC-like DNA-binding protein